jgi:hypothetical protein
MRSEHRILRTWIKSLSKSNELPETLSQQAEFLRRSADKSSTGPQLLNSEQNLLQASVLAAIRLIRIQKTARTGYP